MSGHLLLMVRCDLAYKKIKLKTGIEITKYLDYKPLQANVYLHFQHFLTF